MRRLLFAVAALAFAAGSAHAQKRCRKGIPCGNTCISATKTCHIATPAPATTPAPSSSTTRAASSSGTSATPAASGEWVASRRGTTYYRVGCRGATKLSRANLIYFKSEADAKKAGYHHSIQRGC